MMSPLKSIAEFSSTIFSFREKKGKIRLVFLALLLLILLIFLFSKKTPTETEITQLRSVVISEVSSFSESVAVHFIGTVSATSRAQIQSEVPGRVVTVPVTLGQEIAQGTVIATLENASEYASVLQAEGVYDVAIASAAVADVSVEEAQLQLFAQREKSNDAYKSAYITLSGLFYNELDIIFADPTNTYRTPGARLISSGDTIDQIDIAFTDLNTIFDAWFSLEQDTTTALMYAENAANVLLDVVTKFQSLLADDDLRAGYSTEVSSYLKILNTVQASVQAVLVTLNTAQTAVDAAQEILNKAQLGGTSNDLSVANAQVKQALGALKAAQAQYAKTVLRSPIDGVVNAIDVSTGDFVTSFQPIAEIANNDALEITAYVGQSDRELISVQQEVVIEGDISGIVTTIAPAVDVRTGKMEVRIQSTSPKLVNGDTVTFSLAKDATSTVSAVLQVPLTAVKFTAKDGFVFTVEDGMLRKHAVVLGPVRDQFVSILQGIDSNTQIVVDARGLNEGQQVDIISE